MHKVLCVVLGIGLLCGSMAPQDLSVQVPVMKKAVRRAKPSEKAVDPKLLTPPVKLGGARLKAAIQPTLKRPVAGVTGFLRLDARTPYVSGKGSLKFNNASWYDAKEQSVVWTRRGSAEVEFLARSGPTTYLIDFEFGAGIGADFTVYVGDSVATTHLPMGSHHLLYLLEARGGAQVIKVFVEGLSGFRGVEISILE